MQASAPEDTGCASSSTGGDTASLSPFIKCCVVEVQPERAEEFASLCKIGQAESTAGEPGCIRLDILQVVEDGKVVQNKFIVYEIFTDEAAYQHHVQQPYSQNVGAFIQSGGIVHENAYVARKLFLTEKLV